MDRIKTSIQNLLYSFKICISLIQIRGAVAIVTLLGITWLLGVFAVGQFRMVSQFLFCLTTPFQGLIIFYVRVMQSSEAKVAWKSFLTTGSTRMRPRPLSSVRTNSSTHHSSSLHTHSTDLMSSQKSSSFVSALKAAGRGFIGSSRRKSSRDSSKILRKSLSSNGLEKQSTTTANEQTLKKSQSVNDNQYRRLSNRTSQEPPETGMINGKLTGTPLITCEDNGKQRSPYEDPPLRIEQAPLRDRHQMLEKNRSSSPEPSENKSQSLINDKFITDKYEESILTNNYINTNDQMMSLEMNIENERNSVSTSHANHPQKSVKSSVGGGKKSLESLRRVVVFDPKINKNWPFSRNQTKADVDPETNSKYSGTHPSKATPRTLRPCQDKSSKTKENLTKNQAKKKSLSDKEIDDSTPFIKLPKPEPLQEYYQHSDDIHDESHETQPLTDVVPLDNLRGLSREQRATSEQNISPNFKNIESPFRRSVSNVELDCLDQNCENPQENLLAR